MKTKSVSGLDYANYMKRVYSKKYRYVHKNDIIPHLITEYNGTDYVHFNSEIWYSSDNKAVVCDYDAFQDPKCSNGHGFNVLCNVYWYTPIWIPVPCCMYRGKDKS